MEFEAFVMKVGFDCIWEFEEIGEDGSIGGGNEVADESIEVLFVQEIQDLNAAVVAVERNAVEEKKNFVIEEKRNFVIDEKRNFVIDEKRNFVIDEKRNFVIDGEEVLDFIKELTPKMRDHHLIEAHIRDFSLIKLFFLVDRKKMKDEDNIFWRQVLSTIRKSGSQASVSTSDQWASSKKRGGWSLLI
ncbi:hypothetical protein HK099_001281 [Clydaea vesicula]|uniref:Uncharacterized protein n=1 Tax=Clydaea vesicula TaxID=447962 RepID=A0AAD5TWX5_9FUNG|nr:hypothetical protein HK099_001281 [Clydaea vesicula]